jgi:hypothetical protein
MPPGQDLKAPGSSRYHWLIRLKELNMKRFSLVGIGFIFILAITTFTGCQTQSNMFTDTLPLSAQKTTLEEAANTLGFAIPVPTYLPDSYKIQDVYMQDNSVYLLISDKKIEKNVVTQNNTSGIQQYEFRCQMDLGIKWGSQGIPGGLKLPGERPNITPTQGTTIASVIVEGESHNDLWWDWRPNPSNPGMYEIAISAIKQVSKEDLVKVAESIRF